jgi:hypothetical protein
MSLGPLFVVFKTLGILLVHFESYAAVLISAITVFVGVVKELCLLRWSLFGGLQGDKVIPQTVLGGACGCRFAFRHDAAAVRMKT